MTNNFRLLADWAQNLATGAIFYVATPNRNDPCQGLLLLKHSLKTCGPKSAQEAKVSVKPSCVLTPEIPRPESGPRALCGPVAPSQQCRVICCY